MKTHFDFLFAGSVSVALLAGGCASENSATNSIVINPPPMDAPVLPAVPAVTVPTVAIPVAAAPVVVFQNGLAVVRVDSEETVGEDDKGANVLDGNPDTIWHTQWQDATPEHPHEIVLQLEATSTLKGFTYLPRQGENDHGDIKGYEFFVSNDGQNFGEPVAKGEFDASKSLKSVTFAPTACRFIKLKALSEINGEAWTSAAEIGVVKE
jgi:hypothetical protein